MSAPSRTLILYPVFALVLLVALVLLRMARTRFAAVRGGTVNVRFYRTYSDGEEPEEMRALTRHFVNLFEMPVLFYLVVVLTYVTDQVTWWLVGCAWAYVALRWVHTWVHLGTNDVLTRFRVFFTSGMVLWVMWATLLVQLVRAG